MLSQMWLGNNNLFTGTGPDQGKKLRFSAKTLSPNTYIYVLKDGVPLILNSQKKNGKFNNDKGEWIMMGLLGFTPVLPAESTQKTYRVGMSDGEPIAGSSDAAWLTIHFSNTVPEGSNMTDVTGTSNQSLQTPGLLDSFVLDVKAAAGSYRYAQLQIETYDLNKYYLQDQVTINVYDRNGNIKGVFNPGSAGEIFYYDLHSVDPLYMMAFIDAKYNPPGNPDPGYPYTFSVGDPKYDGTMKVEDE